MKKVICIIFLGFCVASIATALEIKSEIYDRELDVIVTIYEDDSRDILLKKPFAKSNIINLNSSKSYLGALLEDSKFVKLLKAFQLNSSCTRVTTDNIFLERGKGQGNYEFKITLTNPKNAFYIDNIKSIIVFFNNDKAPSEYEGLAYEGKECLEFLINRPIAQDKDKDELNEIELMKKDDRLKKILIRYSLDYFLPLTDLNIILKTLVNDFIKNKSLHNTQDLKNEMINSINNFTNTDLGCKTLGEHIIGNNANINELISLHLFELLEILDNGLPQPLHYCMNVLNLILCLQGEENIQSSKFLQPFINLVIKDYQVNQAISAVENVESLKKIFLAKFPLNIQKILSFGAYFALPFAQYDEKIMQDMALIFLRESIDYIEESLKVPEAKNILAKLSSRELRETFPKIASKEDKVKMIVRYFNEVTNADQSVFSQEMLDADIGEIALGVDQSFDFPIVVKNEQTYISLMFYLTEQICALQSENCQIVVLPKRKVNATLIENIAQVIQMINSAYLEKNVLLK